MTKLSVITLTYNKLEYTRKYIESLYKYTKDFELIIIDNGSTDGTIEYLKILSDNVKLVLNSENLGYSKGNNQGIDIAAGEYIAFLNNDILLYPNWFEECEKVFEQEKNAAFVSPREITPNYPHYDSTDEKSYFKYYKSKFNSYEADYQKSFDECAFSCVITKRDIISKIGNFDEKFSPAFFEDNDFKYRAIDKGYDVFVCNKVCYFHYGSVTSKSINSQFCKNRELYYSKYPFAEYLTISAEECYTQKKMSNKFTKFPLNIIYKVQIFAEKACNRMQKVIKK